MQTLFGLASHFAVLGTAAYPPDVVRRLKIINLTALFSSLTSLVHALFYVTQDVAGTWPIIIINLAGAFAWPFMPLFHRINAIVGGVAFGLAVNLQLFAITYLLGTGAGIHLYFFVTPAAALLFFGVEKMRLVVSFVVLAITFFLIAQFLLIPENAAIAVDPELLDGSYTLSAVLTSVLILVIVYYAFRQLSRAEAAAEREFQRSEGLLRNILPVPIAERLKENEEQVIADSFGEATVLFADIVGFTPRAARLPPVGVVNLLNRVFTEFDRLADRYGLEKIKTIGDAYMVCGGLPAPRPDHAEAVADMALDMLGTTGQLRDEAGEAVELRIGIHSGPVVAGVIGSRKFSYDVWGDTVNIAARMESQSASGHIQVSAASYALMGDRFDFEDRGEIEVKGKGLVRAYFLLGRA